MKKLLLVSMIVILIFAVSCGKNESVKSGASIVTTTGMIADLVQNIAGKEYNVQALMGPGVDPHLFKASQGDISRLADADIIFYNGLHLEGKMTDILEKMGRKKNVTAVSFGVEHSSLIPLEGAEGAHDPHIWFDVSLWRKTIPVIKNSLAGRFPQHKAQFEKNAQRMDSVLADLHQWVIEQVSEVPEGQRIMITAHDAFGYFGKAYGIQVYGLQGISTVAEYGVNDVNRMVDLILENKISAVFIETTISKRSIEAVAAGVNGRGGSVKIGGTLYSDAMGGPASGADTYIGMVKANVSTIVDALK